MFLLSYLISLSFFISVYFLRSLLVSLSWVEFAHREQKSTFYFFLVIFRYLLFFCRFFSFISEKKKLIECTLLVKRLLRRVQHEILLLHVTILNLGCLEQGIFVLCPYRKRSTNPILFPSPYCYLLPIGCILNLSELIICC